MGKVMNAVVLNADLDAGRDYEMGKYLPANHVWRHPHLGVTTVPVPSIREPDDVILEVISTSICGTDLHISESDEADYVRFSGNAKLPVIIGHEFVGRVVEKGSQAPELDAGHVVAVESIQSCKTCSSCRNGDLNQCQRVELLGLTVDGALARYVRVKAHHCHRIDALIEKYGFRFGTEIGTLLEPVGCAFNGLFVGPGGNQWPGVKPSDHVVVLGAGPIGLAAIALARAMGASSITAFDQTDERVALAKALGAHRAFNVGRPHISNRSQVRLNERTWIQISRQ